MRCISIVVIVAFASVASGFSVAPTRFATRFSRSTPCLFSEAPKKNTGLVALEKTNIENAAAVTGGIVGFALGGPVIALLLAAVSNYVSKKDSDAGTALRGFGKSVIESYNFLTTLNTKYDLTGSVSSTVGKAVSSAEGESEGFEKVSKTVNDTLSKIKEINSEFDIIGKGKQAAIAAAALSEAALEKVEELNAKVSKHHIGYAFITVTHCFVYCDFEWIRKRIVNIIANTYSYSYIQQYDFVETTKKAATTAVEKVKEQTKKSQV